MHALLLLTSAHLAASHALAAAKSAASDHENGPQSRWTNYVALGDGVAAGIGNTYDDIEPGSNALRDISCFRNKEAYGNELARDLNITGNTYQLRACTSSQSLQVEVCEVMGRVNNATVDHHCRKSEQPTPFGSPNLITLTVGFDDVSFNNVLDLGCFYLGNPNVCNRALDNTETLIGKLANTTNIQNVINEAATNASNLDPSNIFVTGYPSMFNDGADDSTCPSFRSNYRGVDGQHQDKPPQTLRKRINNLTQSLNAVIESQTHATGAVYVDVDPAYDGHRFCDGSSLFFNVWNQTENPKGPNSNHMNHFNGLVFPNPEGQSAIKDAIKGAMGL